MGLDPVGQGTGRQACMYPKFLLIPCPFRPCAGRQLAWCHHSLVMGASRSVISDWAWDPSGERLAVLMAPPHPLAGCLALYATSVDPVVHARLIGFARPPLDVGRSVSQGPPASQGPSRIQGQAGRQGPVRGRVAAHCKFARGALFSVRLGGGFGNEPIIRPRVAAAVSTTEKASLLKQRNRNTRWGQKGKERKKETEMPDGTRRVICTAHFNLGDEKCISCP
eukprot:scaffold203872_cov17-Tisochrysis_lutea.AAC.1